MLADDIVGLMDALGIRRAHVAGLSMGRMIAQEMAIDHPDRVRTLQLHATMARVDPFVRAIAESLLRARAAFGREEFVRTLLPWILSPQTYAERPELVELMVQRLVENPHPASLAGLTRQAENLLGPRHPGAPRPDPDASSASFAGAICFRGKDSEGAGPHAIAWVGALSEASPRESRGD